MRLGHHCHVYEKMKSQEVWTTLSKDNGEEGITNTTRYI